MNKAVLFLIFNRPDTTKKVFEEIRKAKPPRLYIASDGPRLEKEGEREIVEKARSLVLDNIDWPCEVKTLLRQENLGCGKAVSSAIMWFFDNEPDGIILEDDCLPNQSFFRFCEELLDYYKNDKRVMHISGDQFIENYNNGASYYFAKIQHVWGWASWADRWKEYQFNLAGYDEKNITKFSNDKNVRDYWAAVLNKLKKHEIDTWDYQWTFKVVEKKGLCINPAKNLISNIGFGDGGTHTTDTENPLANMKTFEIGEITHPDVVALDQDAVETIYKNHYGIIFEENKGVKKGRILSYIKNILK